MCTNFGTRLMAVALSTLAACTTPPQIGEGGTTLTTRLGAPALVVRMTGAERWFYTSGPLGTTTRAVDLADNRVIAITQNVLTDERFSEIVAGLTADEVLARIGPPYQRVRFNNLRATAWDYRFQDSWGYRAELAVMIGDDQRVVNKVVQRVEAERSDR